MNCDRKSLVAARLAVAAVLAVSTLTLVACNTVSGAGQDLKEASDNTKKAIEGDKN